MNSMRTIKMTTMVVLGSVGLLVGGCKVTEDVDAAQGSVASFESSADMSHVASTYGDTLKSLPSDAEVDAYMEAASTAIQQALEETFAGCVAPYPDDTDPATVGATFSCSGTNGVVSLEGSILGTLTPRVEGRKVVGADLELVTENLVASGRPVDGLVLLSYTIATDISQLDMDFTVNDSRAGVVDILLSGDVAADTACVSFDGSILATSDNFELDIGVTDFERCEGACPSEGGYAKVDVTDARGEATLDISFAGEGVAEVTSSRGRSFEVELKCAQEEATDATE